MSGRHHRDLFADDIDWRSTPDGIRYAAVAMDPDDAASPLMVISHFPPGATVPTHTHESSYMEYIVAGEQTVGKTLYRAGDVRAVRGGAGYGPILVGPEGCSVVILFQHGDRHALERLPRETKAA